MAGINHLYDLYKKDPKYVEKLLDKDLTCEEQLDGSRFSAELNDADEFKFFKRNDSAPITKIDRTLARYYEKAISHFSSFTDEKLAGIPSGWRFGFEYFPNLNPVRTAYERMPKNNLVLTDITVRDPNGKVIDIISDKETLNKWADYLEVEPSPILFKGKLNKEQLDKILDYLNTPQDEILKKFKIENFAAYFLNVLVPGMGKSFMQNTLDRDIEALVFKFDGENPLKIMNPVYQNEKVDKKDDKPSDIYSLTLVMFQEFFQTLNFSKIDLKQKTFEDRYIEFISRAFVSFCKSSYYKNNFSGEIDFEMPAFLTRAEAGVNFNFVKNNEAVELLRKSSLNRDLFKIMLASMRTHKKKPFGFFKQELIWYHNKLVDKIADYINIGISESLLAFNDFRDIFMSSESDRWEEYGIRIHEDGFQGTQPLENIPVAETPAEKTVEKEVSFITLLKNLSSPSLPNGGKSVSVMVSKTAPYHNGIVTALRDMKERTNQKTFLVMIGNPFTTLDTYKSLSSDFLNNNKDYLEGLILCTRPDYSEIDSALKTRECLPTHFCGEENYYNDFVMQTGMKPEYVDAQDYFGTEIPLKALRGDDYHAFKSICPPIVHNYYYKLRKDLKDQNI